jgi:hypothetical protein
MTTNLLETIFIRIILFVFCWAAIDATRHVVISVIADAEDVSWIAIIGSSQQLLVYGFPVPKPYPSRRYVILIAGDLARAVWPNGRSGIRNRPPRRHTRHRGEITDEQGSVGVISSATALYSPSGGSNYEKVLELPDSCASVWHGRANDGILRSAS